ncbi:MAG TPA: hypothetical protein VKM55_12210 [Candidatus Lokiarchaeia archaeon]|nr:hypothetical protein [Candidatus Lokiarchaeia archaeon]
MMRDLREIYSQAADYLSKKALAQGPGPIVPLPWQNCPASIFSPRARVLAIKA